MKIDSHTQRTSEWTPQPATTPCWPRPASLSEDWSGWLVPLTACVLCLLPGYHLEDVLKDFLWVINKRWGCASEEHLSLSLCLSVCLSVSLSLSPLPPGPATLVLQAAQAVMTQECFTGSGEVLAANSQHIIGLSVLIPEVSFCACTPLQKALLSHILSMLTNAMKPPTLVVLIFQLWPLGVGGGAEQFELLVFSCVARRERRSGCPL